MFVWGGRGGSKFTDSLKMAEILCHSREIIKTSTDGRTPANPFGPSTISLLEMFSLCMVGGTSIQDALKFKTKSDIGIE